MLWLQQSKPTYCWKKLGFTLEARIRDHKDAQGKRCDLLRYGLLKSEWEGR